MEKDGASCAKNPAVPTWLRNAAYIGTVMALLPLSQVGVASEAAREIPLREIGEHADVVVDAGAYLDLMRVPEPPARSCELGPGLYFATDEIRERFERRGPLREEVSFAEAVALFAEIRDRRDIPWARRRDGCFARAHYVCRLLEARGIFSRKIFVQGQLRPPSVPSASWGYHVAPLLSVRMPNGELRAMVLDPSLMISIAGVQPWIEELGVARCRSIPSWQSAAETRGCNMLVTERFQYAPEDRVSHWREVDTRHANEVLSRQLERVR